MRKKGICYIRGMGVHAINDVFWSNSYLAQALQIGIRRTMMSSEIRILCLPGLIVACSTALYAEGPGFDRTQTGSNAPGQNHAEFQKQYQDPETCPLRFLRWFHPIPRDKERTTDSTLWGALCYHHHSGAEEVGTMAAAWQIPETRIDDDRYRQVNMYVEIQQSEAGLQDDQSFSGMPIPDDPESPAHHLAYYQALWYPYPPRIRAGW